MSGSTAYTWVGGADINGNNNWTTPANWTVGGVPATKFPNSPTDIAVVTVDNGSKDAIISNGASITVAALAIGGGANPPSADPLLQGGHVLVGGSTKIGGDGKGTLTSLGDITISSTNTGGAIVGGKNGVINAPSMTITGGLDVLVGGGGTFNIPTIINNGDILADGGFFDLGPLVLNSTTISGTGVLEVSGPSTMEINAATAQEVRVRVDPGQKATVVFDRPADFKGSLNLLNPNSSVDLFFRGETPVGVAFDDASHSLVITGAGGAVLNIIPFTSNGVVPLAVGTSTLPGYGEISIGAAVPPPAATISVIDTTTGQAVPATGAAYPGPVPGVQTQYINVSPSNLNISVTTDNWFIHSGSGTDAIAVHGGTNIIDGGTGSNFLTGASGKDTFFIDDRGASTDIWSTLVSFGSGDACTFWGVDPSNFSLNWTDNEGAAGFTGLTLHASAPGKSTASMTLVGYTTADLNNGRLALSFGTEPVSGSNYLFISAA